MRLNPHALADHAILTGRLARDGRGRFLRAFEQDPAAALARVLRAEPTRLSNRPWPHLEGATTAQPRRRRQAPLRAATDAHAAVCAALRAISVDPEQPEVDAAVSGALAHAFATQRAAQRRYADRRNARAREMTQRKARAADEIVETALSRLAEGWHPDAVVSAVLSPLNPSPADRQ